MFIQNTSTTGHGISEADRRRQRQEFDREMLMIQSDISKKRRTAQMLDIDLRRAERKIYDMQTQIDDMKRQRQKIDNEIRISENDLALVRKRHDRIS